MSKLSVQLLYFEILFHLLLCYAAFTISEVKLSLADTNSKWSPNAECRTSTVYRSVPRC